MRRAKEKSKHVTLTDVAAIAGVSVTTASRVFDPKWDDRIKPSTKKLVRDAAEKLGYHGANALARALQGSRTNIVALVTGRFPGFHYSEVNNQFIHALQATGKQVLVFEADPTKDLSLICTQVHQYCVDAIIITASATTSQIVDSFLDTNIPVLVYGRSAKDSNISVVCCDEYASSQKAASFLTQGGHKTFGIITGNQNDSTATDRIEGFRDQVKQENLEILYEIDGDYTYESGYACMQELLKTCKPDAVFCAEDSMAMGAIDAARNEFHLRIPEDISIMGFDNIAVGQFQSYNLTTMGFPISQMVASSVDVIEKLITNPQMQIERVFSMELVVRGSARLPENVSILLNSGNVLHPVSVATE